MFYALSKAFKFRCIKFNKYAEVKAKKKCFNFQLLQYNDIWLIFVPGIVLIKSLQSLYLSALKTCLFKLLIFRGKQLLSKVSIHDQI